MSPPKHVAIIMDGNGRWAEQRGLPRTKGHQRGVENLRTIVKAAGNAGVSFLTLFAFSAENWSRPPQEVNDLMGLMKLFIRRDLSALHGEGVRIRIIGERANLSPDILSLLEESERLTAANQRMTLIVAFNYGARQEIVSATQRLAREAVAGRLDPDQIDAAQIEGALDTAGLPDPDLIIRTSGEMRLSNFLLWQSAYSEFVFAPQFWPDFDEKAFAAALEEFSSRQRRYGGLCEPQKIAL